ncbi:MAG: putative bifunctional diguanylate cyclase/phosphodiesterase [Mycobacterium sp.]
MSRSLNDVVTSVAGELMAADADSAAAISDTVLGDLANYLGLDVAFLRHNDHAIHATKLIAQWPIRDVIPDPDPIGVVYFAGADPEFAATEHLKEPVVVRPEQATDEYQRRIEQGTAVPQISLAVVPLLADDVTTGTLGFIKYGDREWIPAELDALKTIATLFAQLQGRIAAEEQLRYLGDYDDLTGLRNRRSLMKHLDSRLAAEGDGPVAALFIDLDRLKAVNDYLGHDAGDRFLKLFGARLLESSGKGATVARLGGDEFVVIPREVASLEDARALAERIQTSLRERFAVAGNSLRRTASIGVALGVPGQDTASDLMRFVDQAILSVKNIGGNDVAVFTPDLALNTDLRNDIELHLRGGIERGALVVHYLPEVDLRSGELLAVEALVRWQHPTRGLLLPGAFIPIAESCNLAAELGRVVLRSACEHLRRWRSQGLARDLTLRVNVSPVQLVGLGFVDSVSATIAEYGVDAASLCLEITESLVVKDIDTARATIEGLKGIGVKVAIDDFGTGYSSLTRLKSLPVDILKIDQSFVRDLGHSDSDLSIVRAIVALAEAFELDVVAEGVETVIAAETLMSVGCMRAQGYLLSRPIDDIAMQELLTNPYLPLPSSEPTPPPATTRNPMRT